MNLGSAPPPERRRRILPGGSADSGRSESLRLSAPGRAAVPSALKMSCHSERSEESRSALRGIAEERTRARFLSRDCGIGMTGLFHGFWVPLAA
jgi:hypothetical protein